MSNEVDITDIWNLQSMVNRRAKERNLNVEFEHGAITAYTTENKIVLPTPKLPLTRDELDLVYGYMVHETGHHSRHRAFEILYNSGLNPDHPILNLYNMVEDGCMEQEISAAYFGDRKALGKGMLQHVKKQVARQKEMPEEFFKDEDQIKCMAAYLTTMNARLAWDKYAEEGLNIFDPIPPPSSRELYNELEKEGWVKKLASEMTPDEGWVVACDFYKRLYPDADEDQIEKIKKQGAQPGKSGDKKENGEGMPGLPKGGGKGNKNGKSAPGNVSYSWKDWTNSDHKGEGLPATINWDGRKFQDHVVPLDPPHVTVVKCKETSKRASHSDTDAQAASLANAIRIYIQAQARTKIKPEQYKGKIDRRAVTRLAYPPIDSGEWNKKIFYTLENKKYKNTAIGLLVDWSGSMNGQKKELAAEATAKLARVFDIQLRVPTMIAAFSGGYNSCDIGLIKPFAGRDSTRAIHAKFDFFDSWTNGNSDGDALLWMYNELRQRKEQRKIMIVLSDGAPTDGHMASNPDDMLKVVCKSIESKPDFTLIGIGITTNQPKRYYKNNKIIMNIKELDKELLKVLKETYTHD